MQTVHEPVVADKLHGPITLGDMNRVPSALDAPNQALQGARMEAIGRLAGGIAHDFNNLLTVISGYTQMLLDETVLPGHKEVLEDILAASLRAGELTRQLLAFSRRQTIQTIDVDINERILEIEKLLRRVIGEHIELRVNLDAAAGSARVDPTQFDQVILNLAVNARDAMPRGGMLTVRTELLQVDHTFTVSGARVDAGVYVKIAVTDDGAGIADDVLAHIFEPFFTTKEAGRGTGLGLATVYGIVKQHGGFIFANSIVGHGTNFDILLPRIDDTGAVQEASELLSVQGGSERILLVEDEAALRRYAGQILRREGYTVIEAADGMEALQELERGPKIPDLIISDIIMPHMGGPELAKKAAGRWPRLPFLFTSGYIDESFGQSRSLPEGTQFLAKPFNRHELARKVRDILDVARPV
jgi:two-component system, cell cycle sensor histidine kinase and response regulator CckA